MLQNVINPVYSVGKRGLLYRSCLCLNTQSSYFLSRFCCKVFCFLFFLFYFFYASCFAEPPIKVGCSLGLTGKFDVISNALYKGFRLWENHVNREGGILGRPVQLIVKDDKSDPEYARTLYQQIIEKDNVDFLFAPYSSLITEAVLPLAERHDIPMLIAGAAADRLWEMGCHNAIGIYTPASKFSVGLLELMVMNDLNNIAIVFAKDPFSIDLAESSRKWAKRFGLKVSVYIGFKKGTKRLDPFALEAKEQNCQALMVCGHMDESVDMIQVLKRINWRPEVFYASVGPALQAFYDKCGKDAELVFGTSLWEPRANYPGARKFEKDFINAYGGSPGYHAGLAYAGGQVLAEAIREAQSIDKKKVRSTLFHLDTTTIIGRFGVDSNGKQIRQHAFTIQWQEGKKEIVCPKEIRTAEPLF